MKKDSNSLKRREKRLVKVLQSINYLDLFVGDLLPHVSESSAVFYTALRRILKRLSSKVDSELQFIRNLSCSK